MIKGKLYSRLNQRDKTMVLANLTSAKMDSMKHAESKKVKKTGKQRSRGWVEIEADLCKGCLLCIEACPPEVLVMSDALNKMGYHPAQYVGENCTGCGICFYICPEPGTITVYKRGKEN